MNISWRFIEGRINNMELVWIAFIWVVFCIIYFGLKWRKEKKERMIISPEGMKKYKGRHGK